MDTWPFTRISPADFAALTEQEKGLLETMTAAFIAWTKCERAVPSQRIDYMH